MQQANIGDTEMKALSVEQCQELSIELQLISTELLSTRKGMKYEEWMNKIIPIEQVAYAKAIHNALPEVPGVEEVADTIDGVYAKITASGKYNPNVLVSSIALAIVAKFGGKVNQ